MIVDYQNHIWKGKPSGEVFLYENISVEALLRDMDLAKVEMAGVAPIAEDIQNVYLVLTKKKYPDRIFSYCIVNPRLEKAKETLRHYLDDGLNGLKLHPRFHAFALGNHALVDPLLEICMEYRVPVFDPGNGSEDFNTPLHFEEIAKAFPEVPICCGHMDVLNSVEDAIMVA